MAVAFALDRILILPTAWCYCDKIWNNIIGCRAPGSEHQATLPFVCPLDHIFDPQSLFDSDRQMISFREHNFLDNPRVPDAIRNNIARIRVLRGDDDINGPLHATARMEQDLNKLYLNVDNGGVNTTKELDKVMKSFHIFTGYFSFHFISFHICISTYKHTHKHI